jgi:hypothetical protein
VLRLELLKCADALPEVSTGLNELIESFLVFVFDDLFEDANAFGLDLLHRPNVDVLFRIDGLRCSGNLIAQFGDFRGRFLDLRTDWADFVINPVLKAFLQTGQLEFEILSN